MKVKNDHKILMALEDGLNDGVMAYAFNLPANDRYYTQKESKVYQQTFHMAANGEFMAIWKQNKHRFCLVEYAINTGRIEPVGWRLVLGLDNIYIADI